MRTITPATENAWLSGDYTGSRRPMMRATIAPLTATTVPYKTQVFCTTVFAQDALPRELPNVKSIKWSRGTDNDTATMTMELYNTEPLPLGQTPSLDADFDLPGYYCADNQTEVLSQRGWLTYDQVQVGDWIYTMRPTDGRAEWAEVQEVFAKEYSGPLVSMQSKSMSALVTANHRWLVRDRSSRPLSFRETRELRTHDSIPLIAPRDDCPALLADDLVELLGWVATDGTFQRTNGRRVTIYQSRVANADKCDRIRLLLKRLNVEFSEHCRPEGITHFRFSGAMASTVRDLLPNKKLTSTLINMLNPDQCQLLLEVLALGDGGRVGGDTLYVCTKDKEQAGLVQMIAALAGFSTREHERHLDTPFGSVVMYYVNIKKAKHVHIGDLTIESVPYEGIVWCPRTVNGTFFARRDGRVYFTGNTYNRGRTSWSTSRWGQSSTGWHDLLVPDRIVRTYEGYGFNPGVAPELDDNMYLSGVWMIDTVDYTADGMITVTCRDLARILMDQILFVPVVPLKQYPLSFVPETSVPNPDIVTATGSTVWKRPAFSGSSTTPYVGLNGSVHGHRGTDAFDTSTTTYWLSIGNGVPSADYSFEWIEGKIKSNTVSAIKFKVWGGPYRVYVSVFASGAWQGDHTIPYNPDDPVAAPNGSNIRFVTAFSVGDGVTKSHKFSTPYTSVTKVRLTFTHLYNSGIGPFVYRAGCRDVQIAVGSTVTTTTDGGTHTEGNFSDYSDIIKLLLAYGGFYWPNNSQLATRRQSDNTVITDLPGSDDLFLKKGRIWGDLQQTNTASQIPLTVDMFDKQPIMDVINNIRDIVGFTFFVDETGGAIWRLPNVWDVGNWLEGVGRTTDVITIDERTTLIGLTASLSSANVREKIFVANVSGLFGAVAPGFNPYPCGLRRISGWTDQNFEDTKSCQIMADMIAVRQMYTYRSDQVVIAGNPAIQIDDQVRIYERVTNEGFLHYVTGIDSEWDLETGKWTYTLTTNWLGVTPFTDWVLDPGQLSQDTKDYLNDVLAALNLGGV